MYDLLVIGGGPAGATTAMRAAKRGLRVLVLERDAHPRFHVGESFLPRNLALIRELGLENGLRRIPQTRKLGASFALGGETEPSHFRFDAGLLDKDPGAFNIERAPFDSFLLESARAAGAEVLEGTGVHRVLELGEDGVAVESRSNHVAGERYRARYVIDASGQGTVIGRFLKTRRTLQDLKRVAYYAHYDNVDRSDGIRAGFPRVVMCEEGWFWFIPIDERRTSVGLVMDAESTRRVDVPAGQMLAWGISRCPLVSEWMAHSHRLTENMITADFSYTCRPYAGPGYFLVGDAATFVDPIFSTGVCLGMMSAVAAADGAYRILATGASPSSVQRTYRRFVERSTSVFFRLVRGYYKHAFRELFLQGVGPLEIHRAVISVLCGHVFPKPCLALRWRLRLFEAFVWWQERFELAPRRPSFSLLEGLPRTVR